MERSTLEDTGKLGINNANLTPIYRYFKRFYMELRVLIVAEHASAAFGGEAALPLNYYRILRQRNIPTWLVVHARTRRELQTLFPQDSDRIIYIPDTKLHKLLSRLSSLMNNRMSYFTTGFVMRLITQFAQRRIIRRMVQEQNITVIHQPIPVSPKEPSMMFDLGAPVIIGPMNGGMNYPPAFQNMQNQTVDITLAIGRSFSNLINRLIPGKRQATILLVANERTRKALPKGLGNRVIELVENGVDFTLWDSHTFDISKSQLPKLTRYVFLGRLVNWKAVDLLLLAFKKAALKTPMTLTIIGNGTLLETLTQQARELELLSADVNQPGTVNFAGWMSQSECAKQLKQSDALVLPSLLECGGAVVLEAMAMGIPVIATDWGGPADYLDNSCGILVKPLSRENFVENLSTAMVKLAQSPQERQSMGKAGRERALEHFDWKIKVDRILEIYQQAIAEQAVTR